MTPSVLLSYSHDSQEHAARVRRLAEDLRVRGIDVRLDQFLPELGPEEGWITWMQREVDECDWIVMIFTETYCRRLDKRETPGQGYGATFEGALLMQMLYEAGSRRGKLVPVVFEGDDAERVITTPFRSFKHFCLPRDLESLLRGLNGERRAEAGADRASFTDPAGAVLRRPLRVTQLLLAVGVLALMILIVVAVSTSGWLSHRQLTIPPRPDAGRAPEPVVTAATTVPRGETSLEMGFEILAKRRHETEFLPLKEGGELSSKVDDYCIIVTPPTAGYLYVFQQDASGHVEWLFPENPESRSSSGTNPVAAGRVVVPAARQKFLYLDSVIGTENIVAAFSPSPWPQFETALKSGVRTRTPPATFTSLMGQLRGPGGMRSIPAPVRDRTPVAYRTLDGRTYSLPTPADLYRTTGQFWAMKRSFMHVP